MTLTNDIKTVGTNREGNNATAYVPNNAADNEDDVVDGDATPLSPGGGAFNGDPWRFMVLLVFVIHSLSNAMQWITYSPIVDEVKSFYSITSNDVDMFSSIYLFAYVAFVFVSCKAFEVSGLKRGLVVAATCNTAGAALKLLSVYGPRSVAVLYVSQCINSITEIFVIATPPLIATEWFLSSERTAATALMTSSLNLGIAVGMLIPTLFVGPGKESPSDFATLYWLQFGVCVVPLLGTLFLTPAAPTSLPSMAAHKKREGKTQFSPLVGEGESESGGSTAVLRRVTEHSPLHAVNTTNASSTASVLSSLAIFSTIRDSFSIVFSHRAFLLLNGVGAVQLGLVWAIATVLPQILKPFGISEGDAGWMGFLNLMLGTFVAPFVGSYVDRTKRFKTALLLLMFLSIITIAAMVLGLQFIPEPTDGTTHNRHRFVMAAVLWSLAGICQNTMLPLFFEFGVELTFPHSESTTAPILAWSGSAMALILIAVFGQVLGDTPTQHSALSVFIIMLGLSTASSVLMLFVTPELKRHAYESMHRSNGNSPL